MAYHGGRRRPPAAKVRVYTWPAVVVGLLLILIGLFMLGFWARFILEGGLPQGLATVENNSLIVYHIAAESLIALLALAGGLGLVRGRLWGASTALTALGGLLYSTINSLGFSLRAAPELTPLLASVLAVVVLSFLGLRLGRA